MMQGIKLPAASDYHVHVRQGDVIAKVIGYHASQCSRIMVMPNTKPPIATAKDVRRYYNEIRSALNSDQSDLRITMSIKLLPTTTPEIIRDAYAEGARVAKLYPCGVTTNAEDGISADALQVIWRPGDFHILDRAILAQPDKAKNLLLCLEEMQKVGMILSIHGEMPGSETLSAEQDFLGFVAFVLREFPALKVILEHITTREAVDTVIGYQKSHLPCRFAATITPHHLWLTHDDVVGRKIRPWNFCLPLAKWRRDREALIRAATSGARCFFLGSDSAPHPREDKECAEGCAGIWNAPVLMPSLIQIFEERGTTDRLVDFIHRAGNSFYGYVNEVVKSYTWMRKTWQVPEEICGMRPFMAGHNLHWMLEK